MTSHRLIKSDADITHASGALRRIDPTLAPVMDAVGEIPLRWSPDGFEGLVRIVLAQQLSVASAEALWRRAREGLVPLEPETVGTKSDDELRAMGLSRPKIKTLRALSDTLVRGDLRLAELAVMGGEEAHAALCAVKGIGPWTADLYLLFCLGHPDIFPIGDLALQKSVQAAYSLDDRPQGDVLTGLAARWAPWRSVAARLFWAYYRVVVMRGSRPVDTDLPI